MKYEKNKDSSTSLWQWNVTCALRVHLTWSLNSIQYTLTEFEADDSLKGGAVKDIHGPRLKKMRMAWLSSANPVGFEIIEYVEPKAERRSDNFEFNVSPIYFYKLLS